MCLGCCGCSKFPPVGSERAFPNFPGTGGTRQCLFVGFCDGPGLSWNKNLISRGLNPQFLSSARFCFKSCAKFLQNKSGICLLDGIPKKLWLSPPSKWPRPGWSSPGRWELSLCSGFPFTYFCFLSYVPWFGGLLGLFTLFLPWFRIGRKAKQAQNLEGHKDRFINKSQERKKKINEDQNKTFRILLSPTNFLSLLMAKA